MLRIEYRRAVGLSWLAGLAIVMTVWLLEHGLGYLPCPLCLWQRVLWYALLIIAPIIWRWPHIIAPRWGKWLLCAMFAANAALAVFHSGVEMQWWQGLSTCARDALPTTMAAFQQQLSQGVALVRCDTPALTVAGLSLSDFNAIANVGGLLFIWRARCGN